MVISLILYNLNRRVCIWFQWPAWVRLRRGADMGGAARRGKLDLAVALGIAGALRVIARVVAGRAGDALTVEGGSAGFGADRHAAGAAQAVRAVRETVPDRDALSEHETFAFPAAFRFRNLFEIGEDAALEMVDRGHALRSQQGRRLLATNAPGAEHRDARGAGDLVAMGCVPGGKVAEARGLRVDGPPEGADLHLIVVARVEQQRTRLGDQRIPLCRRDIVAGGERIEVGHAHGDDLALYADLHAQERHRLCAGPFDVEIGAAGQGAQGNADPFDRVRRAGDGAVDAFMGDEQRALDAFDGTERGQPCPQRLGVIETGEAIERGNPDRHSFAQASSNAARCAGVRVRPTLLRRSSASAAVRAHSLSRIQRASTSVMPPPRSAPMPATSFTSCSISPSIAPKACDMRVARAATRKGQIRVTSAR